MFWSVLAIVAFVGAYAAFHSWTASFNFKDRMRTWFGPAADRWFRLAYNIVAGVTLAPLLVLLAVLPDQTLYVVPSPWRWLMVGGQVLAMVGMTLTVMQTNAFHFLGLAQLTAEKPASTGQLVVSGFYRWVRHPIYTFGAMFLWLSPAMSVNWLTTIILFTAYFYLGSIHEERRLITEFGAAYETYRQQVPRIIPVPWRRYN